MCKIKEKSELKEVNGYKVVITDKHGHHYSPYTGIRYKVGPVPELKRIGKYAVWEGSGQYLMKGSEYNDMQSSYRLSGIFEKCNNAILPILLRVYDDSRHNSIFKDNGCKLNIVKMKISGNLYRGEFCGNAIILGDTITEIKTTKFKLVTNDDYIPSVKNAYNYLHYVDVAKIHLYDFNISIDEINKSDIIAYIDTNFNCTILKCNQ